MATNTQQFRLEEVFSPQELSGVLESFAQTTGLGVTCRDIQGELILASTQIAGRHPFCQQVQATPEGRERCQACARAAGETAARLGDAYITLCHMGLVVIYAPVVLGGAYGGFISCGPLRMWEWDEVALAEMVRRTEDRRDMNGALLMASVHKVPVVTPQRVQSLSETLMRVVRSLTKDAMHTLEHRKELTQQQAQIAEWLFEKKRADSVITAMEEEGSETAYPLHRERDLLGKVRLGDRQGAKKILNEILGSIFFHNAGNLDVIKARSLELVVVISRAAVESGASLEKMLGLNYEVIGRLSQIQEFDELCHWLVRVLDAMMDAIYDVRNVRSARLLADVMSYIREHHAENLSLEGVAAQVHLSPFYLSHLFREELGITFVEYLTRVRIERAKNLLKDGSLSIVAVSAMVGYEDPGYFSKVFKRSVGLPPNQYRKSFL